MSHGEVTIHPGVVQHYLGSTSIQLSQSSQISPSSDMDDQEWEEIPLETTDLTMIASLIAEEQTAQFLHEGAQVPRDHNPFSHSGAETVFTEALEEVQAIGYIPSGLGMLEEEWDGDGYPELEVIHSGKRGKKELTIVLPDFVWRPKAIRWCQALAVLNHTLAIVMDTE